MTGFACCACGACWKGFAWLNADAVFDVPWGCPKGFAVAAAPPCCACCVNPPNGPLVSWGWFGAAAANGEALFCGCVAAVNGLAAVVFWAAAANGLGAAPNVDGWPNAVCPNAS